MVSPSSRLETLDTNPQICQGLPPPNLSAIGTDSRMTLLMFWIMTPKITLMMPNVMTCPRTIVATNSRLTTVTRTWPHESTPKRLQWIPVSDYLGHTGRVANPQRRHIAWHLGPIPPHRA